MKRYRLKKDLPTFKAGETFTLWDSIETQGLCRDSDDIMAYHQKTLDKFPNILTDWFEEIKPAEPLIKDEKVRKAVRAWAEANEVAKVYVYGIGDGKEYLELYEQDNGMSRISIKTQDGIWFGKVYTVTELCGEE